MRRMFTMLCWTWSANHFELKKWTQNTIEWTCDSFSREVSNTTTSASFSDYVICQFVKSGATVLFYNPGQVKHKFSFFSPFLQKQSASHSCNFNYLEAAQPSPDHSLICLISPPENSTWALDCSVQVQTFFTKCLLRSWLWIKGNSEQMSADVSMRREWESGKMEMMWIIWSGPFKSSDPKPVEQIRQIWFWTQIREYLLLELCSSSSSNPCQRALKLLKNNLWWINIVSETGDAFFFFFSFRWPPGSAVYEPGGRSTTLHH